MITLVGLKMKAKLTEAEVVFEAGLILRNNNINFNLEERICSTELNRCIRADITIKDRDNNLLLVVEVKRSEKSFSEKQGQRYAEVAGVPAIYCRGKIDALNILEKVKPYISNHYPELN